MNKQNQGEIWNGWNSEQDEKLDLTDKVTGKPAAIFSYVETFAHS